LAPDAVVESDWEALLDAAAADVVIVASDYRTRGQRDATRAEQLRRLAQAARPLLVVHPAVVDLLVYYELDMIARSAGGLLRHYYAERGHPAVDRLRAIVQEATETVGQIEQVVFQRRLADRSPEAVTRQFARDVDLLRRLHPRLNRVSALGADDTPSAYANLAVQLSGEGGPPVRWAIARPGDRASDQASGDQDAPSVLVAPSGWVAPGELSPSGTVTIEATEGRAVLTMPADGAWRLAIRRTGMTESVEPFSEFHSAENAIAALDAARTSRTPEASSWQDATRAMELADSIEISLRRGRAIEVPAQDVTETTVFRGRMATIGCGLLLLAPVVIMLAGFFGDTFRFKGLRNLARHWPEALLAVLGFFLLLQFLPRLLLPGDRTRKP
jgi:predicted dehydrogenase